MEIILWPAWGIVIFLSGVCLYGLVGIVRVRRLGDRNRLKNLLWAELTVGLLVAGIVITIMSQGHDRPLPRCLIGLSLLIQASRFFIAAKKADEGEPPPT